MREIALPRSPDDLAFRMESPWGTGILPRRVRSGGAHDNVRAIRLCVSYGAMT
jgi:hypothetical protein